MLFAVDCLTSPSTGSHLIIINDCILSGPLTVSAGGAITINASVWIDGAVSFKSSTFELNTAGMLLG